ncbi:DUF3016 domain-containing protein [Pelagicoccus mobilis]|uniref:DUF3016 domain-containing protein n=1 Tax=Pelagicoccus mobilis TaxID=415221 RepID=A0A934RV27_9BACT|nr:DUF3016 domain-containing protein [Pelagicoccus mobilis]MBK1878200.1 DUF3016 domain-containing protein [Pelagicoccus mobilis]
MKTKKRLAAVAIVAMAAYSTTTYAIETSRPNNQLQIEFVEHEQYTDIETDHGSPESSAAIVEKSISSAFQKAANKYLPRGYTLKVSIDDIDLAGDRSMMSSTFGDIRVYREIYPPHISFTYRVYSPSEQLLAKGEANKTDLAYLYQLNGASLPPEEEAPYITELVRDWASNELRRAVTKP